jgi:CRISPR-associated protein Cmr3
MMMEIIPLDTLFFRDGKPFTMGAESWANGIFLPLPSTLYGALRTAYISHSSKGFNGFSQGTLEKEIGTLEKSEQCNFKIKNILLKKGSDTFYPLPLDLGVIEKSQEKKIFSQTISTCNNLFFTNTKIESFLQFNLFDSLENFDKEDAFVKLETSLGFIDEFSFSDYLSGTLKPSKFLSQKDFFQSEPKIGIKRSLNTHTSEEGYLYRIGMSRLCKVEKDRTITEVSLLIQYEGLSDFPQEAYLKLGGEGKCALSKKIEDDKIPQLSEEAKGKIRSSRKFKIYFATPTLFKQGWLPNAIEKEKLLWKIGKLELKLLSASIGKPLYIGGWDIKKNKQKPMRKAVPSGSVYYWEIRKGEVEDILETFHNKNISDDLSHEGYGLSYLGCL